MKVDAALQAVQRLYVGTAIMTGCDAILTNDLDIKRVQELSVLVLDELEL